MEPHDARIDDLHLLDVLVQGLRGGAVVALKAEGDILGGQLIAVVEFEVRAELEFIGQAVLALGPCFGEARPHLLSRIGPHQHIVDRIHHAERRDLRRRAGWIEPARRDRHVPGDDGAARGRPLLGGRRSPDDQAGRQKRQAPAPQLQRHRRPLPWAPAAGTARILFIVARRTPRRAG
jgi:hypothetical protein